MAQHLALSLLLIASLLFRTHARPHMGENPMIHMITEELHELDYSLLKVVGHTRHALDFARFAHRYGKKYNSANEIRRRFHIFAENLEMIKETNSNGLTYTLGINEFADLTWQEFRGHRLGAAQNCSATKGTHKLTDTPLPDSIDWRKTGIVSPVKDQGSCGSCWTFSTTGALEAAYTQATKKGISLSEQQLVDCAMAFNNFGCNGGLPSQAFEYIKYNGGLETEESYPYLGKDGVCKFNNENVGAKVANSVNITLGAEDELKHAVGTVRPVSIAFQVVADFRFYKGGVYTSKTCGSTPMVCTLILIELNYILIKIWKVDKMDGAGRNMCGVATCASYPIVGA
ncbi:thiol protease aleurain-like [Amborella trichopoda]|uniref:thiol protease aleurain-like n=1 Tax=Amborella trichopoda TaxID=13333 RepID=UPI0009C14763|nr:thiol protease aleurain-like [Amborella trichopoda]|eukprot:XP_020526123.1 thiol protease aleurain-like [Amborella trichopoda]